MEFGATILGYFVAGILKPIVMLVSGIIVIRMAMSYWPGKTRSPWLYVPADQKPSFRILLLSMVFFGFSELFCATETYVLMCSDATWQMLHSLSSGAGMGLFAVGLFMLLDNRLIHFGEGACVLKPVCVSCSQKTGAPCKFQPIIVLGGILVILASLPPLFASTAAMTANPSRFDLPFDQLNNWYDQVLLPWLVTACPQYRPIGDVVYLKEIPQQLDYRFYPLVAIALTLTGLLLQRGMTLAFKLHGIYMVLFAAGLLGYTYYQLVLQRAMGDLLLAALGHEVGELYFLIVLVNILQAFFPPPHKASTACRAYRCRTFRTQAGSRRPSFCG